MRRVPAASTMAALLLAALSSSPSHAFTRTPARFDGEGLPCGLSVDCTLNSANLCSGWIWVFDDVEGAVWGTILDPAECVGGCPMGGAVSEIYLYGRCSTPPGGIGGVGIAQVDATGCITSRLWQSPPQAIVHCVSGDRWTTIPTPLFSLMGNPFVITVTWGPQSGGVSNPQLATDEGIRNWRCRYEGSWCVMCCASSTSDCSSWIVPPQRTFIYVTDVNGDGVLDDLCSLYGAPYPLSFPYLYPYGYLPNNLILSVGLDCGWMSPVEHTTWGGVKALFR